MASSSGTSLSIIPLETLEKISHHLPVGAIIRLSSSSRSLRRIVSLPTVWERLDFSDLPQSFSDSDYTNCLAQLARWIAPTLNCSADTAEDTITRGIVEMTFDGTAIQRPTLISALQLPRVRRLSFHNCEGIRIATNRDVESLTSAPLRGGRVKAKNLSLRYLDIQGTCPSAASKNRLLKVAQQLKKDIPGLVVITGKCNECGCDMDHQEEEDSPDEDTAAARRLFHLTIPAALEASKRYCRFCIRNMICDICQGVKGEAYQTVCGIWCEACRRDCIICPAESCRKVWFRTMCYKFLCNAYVCRSCLTGGISFGEKIVAKGLSPHVHRQRLRSTSPREGESEPDFGS